jgi:hypothetical protein
MRTPPNAEKNSASVIIPTPRPRSPWRVVSVQPLPNFRLRVRFVDGTQGEVDLKSLILSPSAGVFAVLADVALFEQVFVDFGAVTWPGELDLAPDAMYEDIKQASSHT